MRPEPLGILAAAAALASLPFLGAPAFYESFLYLVFHWMILAVSWNILSGYTGYFSFGHGAFFGAGVYATAHLAGKQDWPFLATLPVAVIVPAALGVALGAVVFRLRGIRGEVFALLTLAVTFVLATIIANTAIDGGPGVYLIGASPPRLGPTPASDLYLMALIALTVTLLIAWSVHASRFGRGLFAIHDDEDVAEVMGVPTYRFKLIALALSSGLAGLAGGIQAIFISYVTVPETFSITVPLMVVLMSILGGARHWAGPAIGALAITLLNHAVTSGDYAVAGRAVVGLVLVVVILFLPEGVMGTLARWRRVKVAPPPEAPRSPEPSGPVRSDTPDTPASGGVLLRVEGLTKSFSGLRALDQVTLEVRRGEILGLIGPNGSGKSTFINVVSGHYRPTGGRILFEGRDLAGSPAHAIAHAGIARTYQIPRPFARMTVLDNVTLVAMYGGQGHSLAEATAEAWHWLAFAGLAEKAGALPDDLNLHQRKFLELARALAARPRLLLLDEVLSGLTPSEINDAIAMVRRIRELGTTIVFVEHVMRAVMALTDRIVVLNHGALIAEGPPRAVMDSPEVRRAYLGTAHA